MELELDELKKNEVYQSALLSQRKEEMLRKNIISPVDVRSEMWNWFQNKKSGIALPWRSWADLFSIAKGEMTIISGYSGHGKSDFVNQIGLHCVKEKSKVFISSLELTPGNLYGRLLTQATGISNPTYEYIVNFTNFYDKKLWAYELRGTANVDDVLESATELYDNAGVEVFIFDNLMMLNSLVDDFTKQFEITEKLLRFAKDKNVCVILVAHSRKPARGMPNPGMYDVSGSSNIINMVDNHMSVTKNLIKEQAMNKDPSDLTDTELAALKYGDSLILRDKKREIGQTFFTSLYFDKRFHVFKENEYDKCFNYLEEKYI